MLGVTQEGDKVVLLLTNRSRDVLLTCAAAFDLTNKIRERAIFAANEPAASYACQHWNVFVESYDGLVALRFTPPEPGPFDHVPMPWAIAEKFADLIEFKAQQAKYKMRFEFSHN